MYNRREVAEIRTREVFFFTQKEEEFADLLVKLGIKRNVAKVVIYLGFVEEATSREIERGTDLRQPEVSIAMAAMLAQKWVSCRESKAENKGRPVKIYQLACPIGEILDGIEKEKREEAEQQLRLIKQMREYLP